MEIVEWTGDRWALRELLLLADPSEALVRAYLDEGFLLAALEGGRAVGEALVIPAPGGWELKNLAVAPAAQGRGTGGALVRAALGRVPAGETLWVGTADGVPPVLRFYERCGFRRDHVVKGFFLEHYPEPVYDFGVRLEDMVYLKQKGRGSPVGTV